MEPRSPYHNKCNVNPVLHFCSCVVIFERLTYNRHNSPNPFECRTALSLQPSVHQGHVEKSKVWRADFSYQTIVTVWLEGRSAHRKVNSVPVSVRRPANKVWKRKSWEPLFASCALTTVPYCKPEALKRSTWSAMTTSQKWSRLLSSVAHRQTIDFGISLSVLGSY